MQGDDTLRNADSKQF
jgi:hypothetical protein